jgi:L-ascorbate metabolism protein UlaG (beta-lactamase superfamily)
MPSRRRLLKMLASFAAVGAGGWALLRGTRANAYYQGPLSDHFDGTRFFNPSGVGPKGPGAFLKWQLSGRSAAAWPASYPSPHRDRPPARHEGDGTRIAYVGHASFLIQTRGRNLLVDPVWAPQVGPVSFIGPRRANAPGIAFEDLPNIDAVLVTHNHYDHMDTQAIGRLWQQFRPRVITPLGNDTILAREVPGLTATAVDWGDKVDLGDGLVVHVEPTVHWSARGLGDRMYALWASFVLQAGAHKIYCIGDTGFADGSSFRRVRERHPDLALALVPIGAYEPRWFMRNNHINPDEAVQVMQLSGAPRALGHHWGTFHLTDEAIEQPMLDLAVAREANGIAPGRFPALRPGEVHTIG